MAEINNLSTTDASNTARFPEGMRVNAVNDSARALEGMIARGLKDVIDGSITSAGTTTAYTVASNRTLTAYYDGMTITVQWNATCGATPTVNVDSIGAKNLYWPGGAQVTTGDLLINARSIIQYDGTNFQVLTGSTIDTDAALATHIADTSTHGTTGAIVGTTDTQTLTGKTVVVASNTITTAASGNLTSTELNAALAELQTDVDTKTTLAAAQAATAADVVSTNADVVTTNADVVLTNADVVTTNADAATTTQDAIDTAADAASTAADVVSSAASAAQASAAAYGWVSVTPITAATTNLETTDARKYYLIDATSNTIAINLPAIGTDEGIMYGFEVTNVDNAITLVRDGTDYINGVNGNYAGLLSVGDVLYCTSDDSSPDNWLVTFASRVTAGAGLSKTGSTMSLDLTSNNTFTGDQTFGPITETQTVKAVSFTPSLTAEGTVYNCNAAITITMPAAEAGKSFTIIHDVGTEITWAGTILWAGGAAPTAAAAKEIYVFVSDGTNWYGNLAGTGYA